MHLHSEAKRPARTVSPDLPQPRARLSAAPGSRQALLAAVCCAAASFSIGAEPVRVEKLTGIALSPSVPSLDKLCVEELRAGWAKLYGVSLPSVRADSSDNLILIGRQAALDSGSVTEKELEAAGPDGHVIKCGNGRIVIAGADGWATYYGVLSLLERLGVRFYPVGYLAEARWNTPQTKEIGPFNAVERPAFAVRAGTCPQLRSARAELADPHRGANPELFDSEKTGSDQWIDHSAGYLAPRLLYYDTHPEYYAICLDLRLDRPRQHPVLGSCACPKSSRTHGKSRED